MEKVAILEQLLKEKKRLKVCIEGCKTLREFYHKVFSFSAKTVCMDSPTVVICNPRGGWDGSLVDMYDMEGVQLLKGVYLSRFKPCSWSDKTLGDYL